MTHPLTPREKVEQAVKDAIREDASVGLQMTLTPRFMRSLVDRVLTATSVVNHEAGLASDKSTAVASGSGDHAELAAKAERCTTGDPWYKDEDLRGRQSFGQFLSQDRAFIAAANPATVLALLAENAALRAKIDAHRQTIADDTARMITLGQKADRATEAERALSEHRITADLLVSSLKSDKAEAERKLAEAVGLLVGLCNGTSVPKVKAVREWLIKEAERGGV